MTLLGNCSPRCTVWTPLECKLILCYNHGRYATYFEGSEADGVACDDEAFEIWKTHLPEDHILKGNKKVVCFLVNVIVRIISGRWEKSALADPVYFP